MLPGIPGGRTGSYSVKPTSARKHSREPAFDALPALMFATVFEYGDRFGWRTSLYFYVTGMLVLGLSVDVPVYTAQTSFVPSGKPEVVYVTVPVEFATVFKTV